MGKQKFQFSFEIEFQKFPFENLQVSIRFYEKRGKLGKNIRKDLKDRFGGGDTPLI